MRSSQTANSSMISRMNIFLSTTHTGARSSMRNKFALTVLLAVLLLIFISCVTANASGEDYRTLKQGDTGPDVYALKIRMYYLGYFNSSNFNDEYTKTTAERVSQLQKANGLPETGIATPELQELIFSDRCVWKNPTPKPSPTPSPKPTPVPTPVPPKMTDEGFLDVSSGSREEYIYEDETIGVWTYISSSLHIEIRRYTDKEQRIRWFETEVFCSEESPLYTVLSSTSKGEGKSLVNPVKLANSNHAVLALSDDYYGHRFSNHLTIGVIIRNGIIRNEKTYPAHKGRFPNLETLAVFNDGSMKTYLSDEHTAQEYLDMGAENVFSFGPILVQNGAVGRDVMKSDYYHYREPRCAIGMIEPYHYMIITVDGRLDKENIRGVYMDWVAQRMIDCGVTEALNLDGGGTCILMFMGKRLNKTGSSIRNLNSMICFGVTDKVQP
ncbi:MAG: hypothetical protein CW338_04535 [Clostridiales bacterium]|nr:hypothetical protein [Clostridiales bacterium]